MTISPRIIQAEQRAVRDLKQDLDSYRWDGLRDHTDKAIDDGLWSQLSTDKGQLPEPQLPLLSASALLLWRGGNSRRRKWWWPTMRW